MTIADAERRRLERDMHDGAQQRLISLALSLNLIGERLDGGRLVEARETVRTAEESFGPPRRSCASSLPGSVPRSSPTPGSASRSMRSQSMLPCR